MLRARFTKQCKLVREGNSETALMCLEISTGDLLTTCKLKNTDETSHLHFNQISIITNKQSQCSSGAGDRHRCKRVIRHALWGVKVFQSICFWLFCHYIFPFVLFHRLITVIL